MGTWGAGNFDSDTAADHLSNYAAKLRNEIVTAMAGPPVELEADEFWGVAVPCNVELLALLAEQRWVGVTLPDVKTVLAWKKKYIAIWEKSIDDLDPGPEWKKKRRGILVATFDRLAKVAKREENPPPKKKAKPKTTKK